MKKRILIIDDEEAYVDILKIHLTQDEDFEVDEAFDVTAGIAKLDGRHYDLVMLDILLPKIEGHEALPMIKEKHPVPIIVMSGYMAPHQQEAILRAGAYSCFNKSDTLDQIYSQITSALYHDQRKSA